MSAFPQGWVPIRIHRQADGLVVDWCDLGEQRFREPFFDQTIDLCLRSPFNQLFRHRTPISALADAARDGVGTPPTGFIFHMSRCGSTLVSQMLAALPQNIVISEASPIDAVLRANEGRPDVSDDQRLCWLRGLLAVLSEPRRGERHFFVKFDCWHVLELPLLRGAFPTVPWIFLYRDPVEVLVSQMKMRGAQMVPGIVGPALFKIDPAAAVGLPAEDYCARVLAAICRSAVRHVGLGGGMMVNYRELPRAVPSAILPHFRMDCTERELATMAEIALYDAKAPSIPFERDTSEKARAVTDKLRAAADTWLAPVYRELEALGAGSSAIPSQERDVLCSNL